MGLGRDQEGFDLDADVRYPWERDSHVSEWEDFFDE